MGSVSVKGGAMIDIEHAALPDASLTDEMIRDMRSKAGLRLRIEHSVFNEEATRIAIAKFAEGIGDSNPLWTDAEYAAGTRYGSLMAPPSFVIGCFSGLQFGWPGLGAFHSGSHLEFRRPIRLGDRISSSCTYDGFDGPKPSQFAGEVVIDHFTNQYHNQRDELVAEIRWSVINYERAAARQRGKEMNIELPHSWTDGELIAIEDRVLAQEPRGAQPRYFEDVNEGDLLEEITKGPVGVTDEVAFVAGGGAPIPRLAANRVALQNYRRHPAWAFRDPETSALEPVYSVHYNRRAALAMGVPLQYDVGFQRQCWHIQLLTNWVGDDGFVKTADAQYRGFVYLSDVITLGGEILKKYLDGDGEPCVDVRTTCYNQRGDDVMPGSATLILPSRELGTCPNDRWLAAVD